MWLWIRWLMRGFQVDHAAKERYLGEDQALGFLVFPLKSGRKWAVLVLETEVCCSAAPRCVYAAHQFDSSHSFTQWGVVWDRIDHLLGSAAWLCTSCSTLTLLIWRKHLSTALGTRQLNFVKSQKKGLKLHYLKWINADLNFQGYKTNQYNQWCFVEL